MTRETLYVAMTRGRQTNTAYVATDRPDTEPHLHPDEPTGRSALAGVLRHVGAEQSAHESIADQHDAAASIAQLAAEYETIAAAAQHRRWTTLIKQSGLTSDQTDGVVGSEAFGPLCAELRRAQANHHQVETLLPRLIAARPLDDADDIAAVLHHRVATATTRRTGRSRPRRSPRLIVGLIPEAADPMTPEMRHALDERKHLIEQRVHALTQAAITNRARWIRDLGAPPVDARGRQVWGRYVQTVAAYRNRYQITADNPLGPVPRTAAQSNSSCPGSRCSETITPSHRFRATVIRLYRIAKAASTSGRTLFVRESLAVLHDRPEGSALGSEGMTSANRWTSGRLHGAFLDQR